MSFRTARALGAATAALGLLAAGLALTPAAPATAEQTAPTGTLDVLVLGDSYSAGNGATDDSGAARTYGPDGCFRSRVNWGEKYAAGLRAQGYDVNLVNHACSGGVTADVVEPREMDSQSKVLAPTPPGVSNQRQAEAYLATHDPCNTQEFPDEEFWTYRATSVTPVAVGYDCTRHLRPQADFVTSTTDLVLYTMGGNDAGFSSIVQNCFVPLTRTASGCKARVEAARALLPEIRQRGLEDLAALRSRGLRDDARIVQLGYPFLQVDNDYTLSDPPGYDAGNQVRALVTDGNAAIAALIADDNARHPGQASFLTGVPQAFAGHEPDASTPVGNLDRWINQVGDGSEISNWYHPNRLGQTAYAELLLAQGDLGAPTRGPRTTAKVTVRVKHHHVPRGRPVRLRVRVRLSDGGTPRGKIVVRERGRARALVKRRLTRRHDGKRVVKVKHLSPGRHRLKVVYDDKHAPRKLVVRRVRIGRR